MEREQPKANPKARESSWPVSEGGTKLESELLAEWETLNLEAKEMLRFANFRGYCELRRTFRI